MSKKWKNVGELVRLINNDDGLENIDGCHMSKVRYAPHIGYNIWIFRYKGTPVCLWDMGNGHYAFHSAVNHIDILIAWLYEKYEIITGK